MHDVILWCGFLGAWLLVAGPLNQASREIEEEDVERDQIAEAMAKVERPKPVSAWWWLVPPVHFLLRHRRNDEWRRAVVEVLPDDQLAEMMRLRDLANAWVFVAGGAFLIAVKETWELREGYEWPQFVFWLLVVAMIGVCAINVAARIRHQKNPREMMTKR